MAAGHSNRCPSPIGSRTNPNPRNPENDSGNRKSFSKPSVFTNSRRFDPITPANSPSDFARRRSVGEEKENDAKDSIMTASKLQPPANGGKNFMSPTISAASKFTPSPRKKVLMERNDPVRTSISLSDGKAMFFTNLSPNASEDFGSKSEMGYNQNQKTGSFVDSKVADLEKKEVHPVSKPSKRVSFSEVPSDSQLPSESVVTDSESLKLDSVTTDSNSLKIESTLENKDVSYSIMPLEADPSLPPYDPKTNYLSPRPKFLYFKPNPRIEILLSKKKGLDPEELKRVEESLMEEVMSANFSGSSEGSEESIAQDSPDGEMEVTGPADLVIGVDESEADFHPSKSSQPLPVSTPIDDVISEDDFVQKNEKRSETLFKFRCYSTVLMLLIACVSVSVTQYPFSDESVLKDLSLSDLSNLYYQSRAAARFAEHVNQLSVSSISFVSKLAYELGKGEEQGPLKFMNLSDLERNDWDDGGYYLKNDVCKGIIGNIEDDDGLAEDLDAEMNTFEKEEEHVDVDSDEKLDDGFNTEDVLVTEMGTFREEAYAEFDFDEEFTEDPSPDSVEMNTFEKEEEHVDVDSDEKLDDGFDTEDVLVTEMDTFREEAYAEFDFDEEFTEDPSPDSVELAESRHIQSDIIPSTDTEQWKEQNSEDQSAAFPIDQETELDTGSSACADTMASVHEIQSDVNAPRESIPSSSSDQSFLHQAIGVPSLFAAALLALAALVYQYRRKPVLTSVIRTNPLLLSKDTGTEDCIHQEKEFSQNWQAEDDGCPSEMSSSFRKTTSYSRKGGENAAVASSERKTGRFIKRESSASSDLAMGSPSYGSFTTYERIPVKHGSGDEEIVTPVRRSSRIRNHHHHQVTSP